MGDNPKKSNSNKKKKKRGGSKKKMTVEQSMAYRRVSEWVFLGSPDSSAMDDDFGVILNNNSKSSEKLVFEFHSHTICSDGFLSPSKLVERAHQNGCSDYPRILQFGCEVRADFIGLVALFPLQPARTGRTVCKAESFGFRYSQNLTDPYHSSSLILNDTPVLETGESSCSDRSHDTMSGIPEALDAARRFGIKIIPGVEISTIYCPRGETGSEEPVHILAYYSSCGPTRSEELEKFLANIRDGRYLRAKNMVSKLNKLKLPLKLEHVAKIAGKGVAPGRLHVARAMVEEGYVENLKQAFTRYLYDGGPAYSTGSEPLAEEAVQLICETGGIAVLAHPWALKNPVAIVRRLKDAGLHGIEVYRSDGKLAAYSDLADAYDLIKLGGSDFHGRGGQSESDLGSVSLPVLVVHDFLRMARPIWCGAIRGILENYAEDPLQSKFEQIMKFGRTRVFVGGGSLAKGNGDLIDRCLSSWLTNEERQDSVFEAIKLKLSGMSINEEGIQSPTTTNSLH
ncbi:polymerase/histidinol phosphatase-like protein [Actinidia rufa]|uniref:Polymerase/histidinol phosphatase-like protein n=1 Tax=Actinidia rufa TaxID=165716 RepID=A0A7J0ESI3_9ERIC|nr:polymerase/histidinol phosphatase-like protein [Actinidia rufa]